MTPARRPRGRHRPALRESLYDFDLATYDTGDTFDQSLAKGFIEMWGLSSEDGRRRGIAGVSGRVSPDRERRPVTATAVRLWGGRFAGGPRRPWPR